MSAKKLKEFISQVKNGGVARPSHYIVEMFTPGCLTGYEPVSSNLERIALFCDRTEIPGVNLDTVPNRSYGEIREVVFDKKYDPLQMSFYVDNDFLVKNMFDAWMDCIFNPFTRHLGYSRDYTTKFRILVQDVDDKDRYIVTLHEVYPKTIAPIELSYESRDVMKLNVTFAYKYVEYERYGYTNNITLSPLEKVNQVFKDVRENGILDSVANGFGNFDYGFSSFQIPDNYFTSFKPFQESISLKSTGLDSIFSGFGRKNNSGGSSDPGYSDLF